MYHLVICESFAYSKFSPFFSSFLSPSYMCSVIKQLSSPQVWEEHLAYRLLKGQFSWREFRKADAFVEHEEYIPLVRKIIDGDGLGLPTRMEVNKIGSNKKRVVYTYPQEVMVVLKVVAHMLYKYDSSFAPNCYAFRRGLQASDAVSRIHRAVRRGKMWAYKVDIHDYFNSIDIPILLSKLEALFADDKELYGFFERMLSDERVVCDGVVRREKHGVMAGVPTAPFLADVYLSEMDHYFFEHNVLYARYSDDIIVFAEDAQTLQQHKATIADFLRAHKLEVNPSKEVLYTPDDAIDFLGFKCSGSSVDISSVGVQKMKAKIRRKTKALLRWKQRKNIPNERAMASLIKSFNRKFFENRDGGTLTWSRWYFPTINSVDGLKEIDHYLQQNIRYLASERHNKSAYKVKYEDMKRLGYKNLVHEYYAQKTQASDV